MIVTAWSANIVGISCSVMVPLQAILSKEGYLILLMEIIWLNLHYIGLILLKRRSPIIRLHQNATCMELGLRVHEVDQESSYVWWKCMWEISISITKIPVKILADWLSFGRVFYSSKGDKYSWVVWKEGKDGPQCYFFVVQGNGVTRKRKVYVMQVQCFKKRHACWVFQIPYIIRCF